MCREYDMVCVDEIDGKFYLKEVLLVPRWEEIVKGPFDTIKEIKDFINENELSAQQSEQLGED